MNKAENYPMKQHNTPATARLQIPPAGMHANHDTDMHSP